MKELGVRICLILVGNENPRHFPVWAEKVCIGGSIELVPKQTRTKYLEVSACDLKEPGDTVVAAGQST